MGQINPTFGSYTVHFDDEKFDWRKDRQKLLKKIAPQE